MLWIIIYCFKCIHTFIKIIIFNSPIHSFWTISCFLTALLINLNLSCNSLILILTHQASLTFPSIGLLIVLKDSKRIFVINKSSTLQLIPAVRLVHPTFSDRTFLRLGIVEELLSIGIRILHSGCFEWHYDWFGSVQWLQNAGTLTSLIVS